VSDVVLEVAGEDAGQRLDTLVAAHARVSRASAARLIDGGSVTVGDRRRPRSYRVAAGDVVRIVLPVEPADTRPHPDAGIDVRVRYEDPWLLVVSKPAGLVVHPGPGHPEGTLVNALLARAGRPAGGDAERPGIVHRLDAGTSGLMIVAKDHEVHERLVAMLADREVTRVYLALVDGAPSTDSGTIDAPIGRSPRDRKRMAVVDGGREAVTDFRMLQRFREAALVEVSPRTGRTHQIRVHLAAAGYPVLGDSVYGRNRKLAARLGLTRPFLHAASLRFEHPVQKDVIELHDPLPEDLAAALVRAKGEAPDG